MSATIWDKLLLPVPLSIVLWNAIVAAVTGVFRGTEAASSYTDHVTNTVVRTALYAFKIEQFQWLAPSLVDTYRSWCSKNKLVPDVVEVPGTKARAFWMGNKDTAKYTLIFVHGGGWILPGTSQHIDLFNKILKWSNGQIAVFAVSYTLSPQAHYPVAIGECVEAVRYVLNLPGHNPSNTLLGGDSAGGTTVLAILSHISDHPHPQSNLVKPLTVDDDFKGAFVIAPWASSDASKYPSWNKYAKRDIFGPPTGRYWMAAYKGSDTVQDDEYICPALADSSWWKTSKAEFLLITTGEHEILVDSIADLAAKYRAGVGSDRVRYAVGEKEVHISPVTSPLPEARLDELGPERCQEAALRWFVKSMLE